MCTCSKKPTEGKKQTEADEECYLGTLIKEATLYEGKVEVARIRHILEYLARTIPDWDHVERLAQRFKKWGWLPTLGTLTLLDLPDSIYGHLRQEGTGMFGKGRRGHLEYNGPLNLLGSVDGMHRSLGVWLAIWLKYRTYELSGSMLVNALVVKYGTSQAVLKAYGMVSRRTRMNESFDTYVLTHD
jgi:hypothetical protein